jgi:hypothetical protein
MVEGGGLVVAWMDDSRIERLAVDSHMGVVTLLLTCSCIKYVDFSINIEIVMFIIILMGILLRVSASNSTSY